MNEAHGPGLAIGDRRVGLGHPCFLVAEVGINHNGDLDLARAAIAAAAAGGADAVKFQNFRVADFIGDRDLTFEYTSRGKTVVESQYDLFARCELSPDDLRELAACCAEHGVVFHSTPTSPAGIADLQAAGAPLLKNGSDYLTHLPLIAQMGKTGLPTVLSTGMATLAEIDDAVRAFRATGNDNLLLLHCTSTYPTPPTDVNLRRIPALAAAFGCPVGFSDHTEGAIAAVGAIALGACWLENHFTLDKNLPGPDHWFSSDPDEWREYVRAARTAEQQFGSTRIGPAPSEARGRREFRLSCVTVRPLAAGDRLAPEDITFQRPGTGIPPAQVQLLIGRRLRADLPAARVLSVADLE